MQTGRPVGTIAAVQRYPVKSMGADPLLPGDLRWNGLQGDRQYAFLKTHDRSRFPWLTGRDVPSLLVYRARYENPETPRGSSLAVRSPSGEEYDVADPRLVAELAALAGEPVQLVQVGRGIYDTAEISVITTTTAARIGAAHGGEIDIRRFRANIVVAPLDDAVWDRDWLGGTLSFGEASSPPRLRADFPIARCAMVTLDPDRAEKDVSVLRTVAQKFQNEVGIYGAIQTPGLIDVGMPVYWRPG